MVEESEEQGRGLASIARNILRTNLGLKSGERLVVITDTEKIEIGRAMFNAGLELGSEAILVVMRPRSRNGEEPPEHVRAAWFESDVFIAPTKYSLTHTQARRQAVERGARGATMPNINRDIFIRTLSINYKESVIPLCRKMLETIKGCSEIRILSELGTDISFSVRDREFHVDEGIYDKPGSWGNLPAGEVYIAPLEGTAEGMVVVDGSISGGVGLVKNPVRIAVKGGRAVSIEGSDEARELLRILKSVGRDEAFNFPAEFGIGCNPAAKLSGVVLEDEKILGTIHLALGDNSTFGGSVRAGVHIDVVLTKPTIYIDGRLVIEKGSWKI
ncbi:MAG TPA: aminopeptidase [Sulfolobales archaeon]|nr:aminopeptidase [Sulfolobales archaeon]